MQKIIETYGNLEAHVSDFKQEREAWTTAAWALGLKEKGEPDSWVEIETEESTPDNKATPTEPIRDLAHVLCVPARSSMSALLRIWSRCSCG
jgi:hypothetical protein